MGAVEGGRYRCRFPGENSWFIFPSAIDFGMSDETVLLISKNNLPEQGTLCLRSTLVVQSFRFFYHHCEILKTPVIWMYA